MKHDRLVLVGFGNVSKAFAKLLLSKEASLKEQKGITFSVTGIRTGRHGSAINPDGIDLQAALKLLDSGGNLDVLSIRSAPDDGVAFINACRGDVMFETTPMNAVDGQPAVSHLRAALEAGMHAITANKGVVVFGYQELSVLANKVGKKFYFESAVMDGAPIFSLFRETLPLADLRGFTGILNSTTNLIFEKMEAGDSFDEAVAYTQKIGLAETDPNSDVDGWDSAIKVAALVTVLMGIPYTPQQVERQGIRSISKADMDSAKKQGKRWKLICTARQGEKNTVVSRVAPEMVSPDSPLYSINGASSYAQFELDTLPGLGVVESNPSPMTTAYGLFADWLNAIK
jgi:homoserine dehydrogenase